MRFSAIVFVLLIFACGQNDTSKQVGVELTTKSDSLLVTTEVVAENKKLSDADSTLYLFF